MRQAAGILRNAAIIGETRDRFTSASVGLRSISRSVSRTQLPASRNVGVGYPAAWRAPVWRERKKRTESKRGGRFPASPLEPSGAPRFNRTRRTHFVHRLLGRGFRHRNNRYESAAVGFCTKLDMAFDLGK